MGKYSIADLEKLSGIKAHTIRIWEQRYNLLQPYRTTTNIRFYDDEQLKKLLNVVVLLKNGIKISEISKFSRNEFQSEIQKATLLNQQPEFHTDLYVNQLISSALQYNEPSFEKTFSTCLLRYGIKDCYTKIIYPLLNKLGLLWGADEITPGQEHFVSNLIKQKLYTAIDGLPPATDANKSIILFLPEGENHELGLLYANYLLRLYNYKVTYLGQSVPMNCVKEAASTTNPTHLMTFMVRNFDIEEASVYINSLSGTFPKVKILISGNSNVLEQLILPNNVIWVKSIDEFNLKVNPIN